MGHQFVPCEANTHSFSFMKSLLYLIIIMINYYYLKTITLSTVYSNRNKPLAVKTKYCLVIGSNSVAMFSQGLQVM